MKHELYRSASRRRTALRGVVAAAFVVDMLCASTVDASVPKPVDGQGWWCEQFLCGTVGLVDVDLVSATDGWMLELSGGDNGTLARWDGRRWQPVQTPATGRLRALDLSSPTEGWAMGDGDVALHWGSAGWSAVTVPDAVIEDVASLTPTDAWAVGGSCDVPGSYCVSTILHWNGRTWSAAASPAPYPLLSIDMLSSGDGWAIGGSCRQAFPYSLCTRVILRWNGTRWIVWREESGAGVAPFTAVSVADPNTGWITDGSSLWRWDGMNWEVEAIMSTVVHSVKVMSAHEAWAAGTRSVWRWNGQDWSTVAGADQGNWLAIDVEAEGGGAIVGAMGAAMAWNGATWSPTTAFIDGNLFQDVDIVSSTEAWAAGASGLFHRVDGRWVRWILPASLDDLATLGDVDLISAEEGWAVGSLGTALHWDGQDWTQVTTPGSDTISDVQTISKSSAWAYTWTEVAGVYHGQVLHWDGQEWTATDIPGVAGLPTALAMRNDSDGWISTRHGELARWNGSTWTRVPSPTDRELTDLAIVAADDAWAVGLDGTLLHWDGLEWTLVDSPTNHDIFGVALNAADVGWAVGENVLLYWDGVAWTSVEPVERLTDGLFVDVDVVGDTGWIVGYQSLLRLDALHTQHLPILFQASH